MKKLERPSKKQVKLVLRQAEEFAAASVGGVLCGLREDPARPNRLYREYAELMRGLEVHYLFPNLNRGDQKVLADLLGIRNRLVVRRRVRSRGRAATRAGSTGGSLAEERRLQRLITQAKKLGRASTLTSVQRGVIEQMVLLEA